MIINLPIGWEYTHCLLTDGASSVILSQPELEDFITKVKAYNAENACTLSLNQAKLLLL
jgi:hypothetical protein